MVKITLLGAGGGVGQPLALLLRLSPLVDQLALYDRHLAPGVAVDLSHIPSTQKVNGYTAADAGLARALQNADIVIIAAGPGVTAEITSRDALFQQSAAVMNELVKDYVMICPRAIMLVVMNPINAIVPFVAELLKSYGLFDARRLFGVTTLDIVRAETFLAEAEGSVEAGDERNVDVVGGHSPQTIVPLMSLALPRARVGARVLEGVVNRVRFGGREVYYAKEQNGGATLSTAYAVSRFTEAVCKGLQGDKNVVQCAYVHLPGIAGGNEVAKAAGVDCFAVPVELATHGAGRIINLLENINTKEQDLVDFAVPALRQNIETGVNAAQDCLSREKSH